MRTRETKPKPPQHLRPSTRTWWLSVLQDFVLDPHHRHLLTAACECLDRAEEAREILRSEGSYFTNRHGERKPHPALQTERDNKALFARLLRELGLDVVDEAKRPPSLPGYGGR